jgi:hypothetical protein
VWVSSASPSTCWCPTPYTTSPLLLVVMATIGGAFGAAGAFASRILKPASWGRLSLALAAMGFALTLFYDLASSAGFAVAYGFPLIESLYLTFVPLYYAWPPIIHTVTNTVIFAVVAPPVIQGIQRLPEMLNNHEAKQKAATA